MFLEGKTRTQTIGNWYPLYSSSKVSIESEFGTEVYQARKKIWGNPEIFTLPPCTQELLHAEWSSHTMTMEGSGWSGHRWEAQSRFSCVCHYQSFLEIPERIKQKNTIRYVCPNVWLVLVTWGTMKYSTQRE